MPLYLINYKQFDLAPLGVWEPEVSKLQYAGAFTHDSVVTVSERLCSTLRRMGLMAIQPTQRVVWCKTLVQHKIILQNSLAKRAVGVYAWLVRNDTTHTKKAKEKIEKRTPQAPKAQHKPYLFAFGNSEGPALSQQCWCIMNIMNKHLKFSTPCSMASSAIGTAEWMSR